MKAVFTGDAPDVTAEQWGPHWERAIQREQAIGPITLGHHLEVPGRTLAQQVRILQAEGHPLSPSLQTLAGWRKAYLEGGRRVQALLDNDRGGKGIPRGWLASPEHQDLVIECEKRLIGTHRVEYPPAALLRAQLAHRVGAAHATGIPGPRALDRFCRGILSAGERSILVGGERRYRETIMPKPPTRRTDHFGQIWVADHRKADNLVLYGQKEIRPWVTAIIDMYSGAWVGRNVSPHDPGSTEIALALRDAILPRAEDPEGLLCGLPEKLYCDWGKDFASTHLRAALSDLGIGIIHARPYAAWSKGSVEGNAFGTMSKRFDPTLDGYTGRNSTERPRKVKAVLSFSEYCAKLRQFTCVDFNEIVLQKRPLNGQPATRLDFARAHRLPTRMPQRDTLLLCLMKRERRVVGPAGISLGGIASVWNPALWTLAEERAVVEIRYDAADMSRAYIFHRGEFVCEATDPRAADVGLNEQDVRERMRLQNSRVKALKILADPRNEAAMTGNGYIEHLAEDRAIEVPMAAAGGSARPIRQLIPRLDRAAQQIRRPGRPSAVRSIAPRRDPADDLPDFADKPLPPGWDK